MSTFFKALEQAERERLRREQGGGHRRPARDPLLPPRPPGDVAEAAPPAPAVEAPPAAPAPEAPAVVETARPPIAAPLETAREVAPPGEAVPTEVAADGVDEHLVSLLQPTSFSAEQYRALRHAVEELRRTSGLTVFAVSSPSVGDGKTTTAINLAGALSQAPDARVLLVEVDLRRPVMAERFGLGRAPFRGLVDLVLRPSLALAEVVRRPLPYNLSVLVAGQPPAVPYEVLESPRFGEILGEARRQYDCVILDTPPIVQVPDCRVIGKWVDGFLVVVAAHRTPRRLLEEALTLMDPSKVIGLVFGNDDRSISTYGSYGPMATRMRMAHPANGAARAPSPRS